MLANLTAQFQGLQDGFTNGNTSRSFFCGVWQGLRLAQRMYDTLSTSNPFIVTALLGNVGTFLQATTFL